VTYLSTTTVMQSVATIYGDRTGGVFTPRVCCSADAHNTPPPIEDGHVHTAQYVSAPKVRQLSPTLDLYHIQSIWQLCHTNRDLPKCWASREFSAWVS